MLQKIKKEWVRFSRRCFDYSNKDHKTKIQFYREENKVFERSSTYQKTSEYLKIPIIKSADETVDCIISNRFSLARFGDGEFRLIRKQGINFQKPSAELSQKLLETLHSNDRMLLVALPDCFGALDKYQPQVADFWRKWLVNKRGLIYSYLEMERTYYNSFFTRAYMPYHKTDAQYLRCQHYFDKIKKIWKGRNVLICEGEGTRFGLLNDLLENANSISRILCPHRNAFDRYDEILSSFSKINKDWLILLALGPTATVLAYDLHNKGFQALDVGHLDIEYEWFMKRDESPQPINYKYTDGSMEGRQVYKLNNESYKKQTIQTIL